MARWIEEGRKRRRREAAPACSHGSVRCRGRWRRSSSGVRGVKSFRIGRSSLFFSKADHSGRRDAIMRGHLICCVVLSVDSVVFFVVLVAVLCVVARMHV